MDTSVRSGLQQSQNLALSNPEEETEKWPMRRVTKDSTEIPRTVNHIPTQPEHINKQAHTMQGYSFSQESMCQTHRGRIFPIINGISEGLDLILTQRGRLLQGRITSINHSYHLQERIIGTNHSYHLQEHRYQSQVPSQVLPLAARRCPIGTSARTR